MQRLYLGRGGPKELAAIGATLSESNNMKQTLIKAMNQNKASKGNSSSKLKYKLLEKYVATLGSHGELVQFLANAIVEDPPQSSTDGGFIMAG